MDNINYNSEKLHIRKAELNDALELAELHVSAWRIAYAGHMPNKYLAELSVDKRAREWQGWIKEPGPGTTIVIESAEGIGGFCVFGPSRDINVTDANAGEILALNVHPSFWRRGYGKLLCNSVIDEIKKRNYDLLTLWTLKANERAKLFYMSLGFELAGAERLELITKDISVVETKFCISLN